MTSAFLLVLLLSGLGVASANRTAAEIQRKERLFSLFSIVSFPNNPCTPSSSTTITGTCMTSSECGAATGSADGSCAAGFGVCCVVTTSSCSTTVKTNTSYVRNPGYPSSYTPTNTGSCVFTVAKVSDDVCQLRLDFQTFSGFATSTATIGACTDYLTTAGQTGYNPPDICGTNTGYHMYVEFGGTSTDTASLTFTYGSTTSAKTYNILLRQIECTAPWAAPTDCRQYFTGATGTIYTYNFGQMLGSFGYTNCLRTEAGYCGVQYKEKSGTTPDAFNLLAGTGFVICPTSQAYIPTTSQDGWTGLGHPTTAYYEFQSTQCGTLFGIGPTGFGPLALTTRQQPFIVGVYSVAAPATAQTTTQTGFALEYTQVPC